MTFVNYATEKRGEGRKRGRGRERESKKNKEKITTGDNESRVCNIAKNDTIVYKISQK